ncbi:bifunctional hydroxymethylpyrimidine kinase/phosphomethylpyrimidine kinase [Teredinibacter waterburyi]|uniref:bifunctional hydroxymethylpyrimidine kinase/phosphomethylpyrimidine kinase n=1 Tax=Teredinibacter waterburyi TaxID=1500538 RepID=UPI00165FBB52|nr:hydroxymethylpyrimidine/phosphomethylpyrimidine kinase [Teredinibacter waterburyi]
MMPYSANPPIILSFATLDPSGSGGLSADIETAASLGCHCAPIATASALEGFASHTETLATEAPVVISQARSVLEHMQIAAIKIGFLGSVANIEAVHTILRDYEEVPVVAHPALCLWDEEQGDQIDYPKAFNSLIVPLSTIGIFSLYEARTIAAETDTITTTARALNSNGCTYTLITGTGENHPAFRNSCYFDRGLFQHYSWEQEAPTCHGASSTMAMSAAAYLAHGSDAIQAIEQAQNFTWQTLRASRELGFGKRTPHRFFWADQNIEAPTSLPASHRNH